MDDHSAPAFKNTGMDTKKTLPPHQELTKILSRQTLIGDWHFESNCNFQKTAPINRLVGESHAMMNLRARITRYAETEETVLISKTPEEVFDTRSDIER